MRKLWIAVAVGLALLLCGGGIVIGKHIAQKSVSSKARITSSVESSGELGVYWDKDCTDPVKEIDFGEVEAGKTSDAVRVYAKYSGESYIPTVKVSDNFSYGDVVVKWQTGKISSEKESYTGPHALGIALKLGKSAPEGSYEFTTRFYGKPVLVGSQTSTFEMGG